MDSQSCQTGLLIISELRAALQSYLFFVLFRTLYLARATVKAYY